MGVLTLAEVDVDDDVEVDTLLDTGDTLVVVDVDTLELSEEDVDTLVLALEYVE